MSVYENNGATLCRASFKFVLIIFFFLSINSCNKDEFYDFSITTSQNGNVFEGVIQGNIPFKYYKSGFRILDESNPLVSYANFCPSNLNKTVFTENINLGMSGTYRICAQVIECDKNMKSIGEPYLGNEIKIKIDN